MITSGSRRPALRRVLLILAGLAAFGIAGKVLYDSSDEILSAADTLGDLRWTWVALAVVVEVVSYLVRGAAQALVLRRGVQARTAGARRSPEGPGAVVLGAGILAGDAAAYCLPFGFAAAGVVLVRVLRRRGVDATAAGWMFAVSTVLYVGSVALLTVVAVQIAGDADPIPGLQEASIALLSGLVVIGLVFVVGRRLRRRAGHVPSPRPPRAGRIAVLLRAQREQLRVLQLPLAAGVTAFALMLLSWFSDIAVLGIAYAALGTSPPWEGLLLAYCAGQVAAALPVTPGGIGVVEGSLTLALVAFGGSATVTLAAVLLYRMIAYWGCIPLGGLAWLVLRLTERDPAPERCPEPVLTGGAT